MDIPSSCPNTTEITEVWGGALSQLVTKQKTVQAQPKLTCEKRRHFRSAAIFFLSFSFITLITLKQLN